MHFLIDFLKSRLHLVSMVESSIGSGLEFEYTRDIKPVFFSKYCQMGSGLKLFKQKALDQDNMKYLLRLIA